MAVGYDKAYKLLAIQERISNAKAKDLIDRGLVKVGDKKVMIARGEIKEDTKFSVKELAKTKVIFEDDDILVVDKPAFITADEVAKTFKNAILLNNKKQRFVNELLPRDVVSKAIYAEMEKEGSKHVWMSFEKVPQDVILNHFPHIYEKCREEGYNILKELIPVVPAQHYFMGGIWVDSDSRTSMEHLYAVGETSCNGVHGANRLASNSLLESLVFAKRAANKISGTENEVKVRELA